MYEGRTVSEKMASFRVTEQQMDDMDEAAAEAGVSRSEYIKLKVFGGSV